MKTQGMLVHTDGRIETAELNYYRDIQNAVGGYFTAVTSATGKTSFFVHDEGKLIGLPINTIATAVLWKLEPAFVGYDFLVGPVLITGGTDDRGDTLSINDEGLKAIASVTADV